MDDRCYISIECFAKDKHLFEELGFSVASVDGDVIQMSDKEANYPRGNSPYRNQKSEKFRRRILI